MLLTPTWEVRARGNVCAFGCTVAIHVGGPVPASLVLRRTLGILSLTLGIMSLTLGILSLTIWILSPLSGS